MKLLLFDIDGTLLLTGGAGVRAMERTGRELFGAHFSMQGIMVSGGLDPQLYAEAADAAGVSAPERHHREFRDRYLELLSEELEASAERVRALPGVVELLDRLVDGEVSHALGIVSGNYRQAAPLKLRAAGIEPERFPWFAYGDEGPDRPSLVALAMERFRADAGTDISPREVLVIGDTPRDIHCAHVQGCWCLAVATGRYDRDALVAAGAALVFEDLSDIEQFLDVIEG